MSLLNSADRFWSKVAEPDEQGCRLWTGAQGRDGYGYFLLDPDRNYVVKAHRMAWTLRYGRIPAGLCVLHRCDRRLCIECLFLGTHQDNTNDMIAKGRARFSRQSRVQVPA